MAALPHLFALTAPLFLLVLTGYGLIRWGRWDQQIGNALTRFVFSVAVPTLLFRLMSGFPKLPPVDARLLLAYFGGSLLVFFLARILAWRLFAMDGAAQSIFGIGGIFSNNLLLGVPLSKTLLGDASLPVVSLVLVFNALLLWTLVTVSVEWARNRAASAGALAKTAKGVITNPVVASIVAGTAWGYAGVPLPDMVDRTLELIGQAAVPLSLIALGMGLAEFGLREGFAKSVAISAVKLAVHPAIVLAAAWALRLPPLETQAVALLAALPVGANVYLMSRQFQTLGGPVAGSLVLSTAVAAVTAPVALAAAVLVTSLGR
jgi:malonate transporter and related proteins